MGIFEKLKGEFIDVIEFVDDTQNTLVHKFQRQGNEIKNGAQLTVRESQKAVFVNEGVIADIFEPGRHVLTTQNLPILTTLKSWAHGFNSPFKADVYFISTKIITGQKWGTKNPITMRDPEFGAIMLRAFGTYGIRISDVKKFITDIAGTNSHFDMDNIEDSLKSLIVTEFTDALGELKIPALDLAANYKELGAKIEGFLNAAAGFGEYGLEVKKFLIENISLPPELESALQKRIQMNMLGNMDQYAKFQAANAMENASKNEGMAGGMMGAGMGMGMGAGMGQMMGTMFSNQQQQGTSTPPPMPGGAVQYFVAVNGQQQGPFGLDQLKAGVSQGQITKDSLVWKQGMAAWAKAGEVTEISSIFGSTPPPLPPPIQ